MRRKKFLALFTAAAVSASSMISAGAAAFTAEPVPTETEMTGAEESEEFCAESLVPEETEEITETLGEPETTDAVGAADEEAYTQAAAGILGKDLLWQEAPAEVKVPETTLNKRLHKAEDGKASEVYYTEADGLVKVQTADGETYLYAFDADGFLRTGVLTIEGVQYYFQMKDETAENAEEDCPQTGRAKKDVWVLTDEGTAWSYFGADAAREAKSGYVKINDEHYYLDENGRIQTGVILVDGIERCFDPQSVPLGKETELPETPQVFGWQSEDGCWYYVNEDGQKEIRTGFQNIKSGQTNGWYFLDENGTPLRNTMQKYEKNGKFYFFGADGRRVTDKIVTYEGDKYYFGPAGARAEKQWIKYNTNRYYFGQNGVYELKQGWQKIGNFWFHFRESGGMDKKKWITEDGKKYYVNENGTMLTGMRKIGSYQYYFKGSTKTAQNGYALTSRWIKSKGAWYYANGSGRMQKGWISLGTKQYYLNSSYQLVTDKWTKNPSGVSGYLDADGLFLKAGWTNYKGNWRYLKEGAAGGWATGWTWIGGYKYYFKSNGDMQTDLSSMPGFTGGPYLYDVNRTTCTITVLGRDENGNYTVPVIAFVCSVGLPGTPTPTGSYGMSRAGRWQGLMGPSYGQYATHVDGAGQGGIFFHSVAGAAPNPYALNPVEFNRLGSPASHGCIRMCVRDAKWMWDHWGAGGNRVRILDRASNIFYKPNNVPKVGPTIHYDPTDPAV